MKVRTVLLSLIIAMILTGCGKSQEISEADNGSAPTETPSPTEEPKPVEESPESANVQEEIPKGKLVAESLRAKLVENSGCKETDIQVFEQDDFDNDGIEEAFALVGEETEIDEAWDMPMTTGNIWFVSNEECTRLTDTEGMGFSTSDEIMSLGDSKYIIFNEMYTTSLVSYVWYVSDGQAKEPAFSRLGEVKTGLDGDGRFRITDSSYDCSYNSEDDFMTGHTWKDYYFFYDPEDDMVHEYGGADISQETAKKFCGKDLVADLLPAGNRLTGLFCRGNCLLVMNYEHQADEENIEYYHYIYDFYNDEGYLVDDQREQVEDDMPCSGTCLEALCPEIASYPEIPMF